MYHLSLVVPIQLGQRTRPVAKQVEQLKIKKVIKLINNEHAPALLNE